MMAWIQSALRPVCLVLGLGTMGVLACFEPPGDLCATDSDCPQDQRCVTLETRSVCLSLGILDGGLPSAADGGGNVGTGTDGGAVEADAGSLTGNPDDPVVALGEAHSCAVMTGSNQLTCWGANDSAQLGLEPGEIEDRFVPVLAAGTGATTPQHLAAGAGFTCGAFDDQVWCWGRDLLTGLAQDRPWQMPVPDNLGLQQLAAGHSHFCALLQDGRVACAGNNSQAQLGRSSGSPNDGSLAVVDGLADIREIALGGDQSCALSQAGQLSCWGKRNDHNEALGEDTGDLRSLPDFGAVTSLAVGATHICALDDQFVARCLGDNTYKQIDLDLRTRRTTTELEPLGIGVEYRALMATRYGSCALSSNSTVYCWGQIAEGDHRAPEVVPGVFDATRIIGGSTAHHRCAQLADQSLTCWGPNDRGQLGRGRYEPGDYLDSAAAVMSSSPNGSDQSPGTSCRQIHEQHPTLPSGRYMIAPSGEGQSFEAYCDMDHGPGGWTLLLTMPHQELDGEGEPLDPAMATYTGSLWNDSYEPVSLPPDFASQVIAYRSPLYPLLSYGYLNIGFRNPDGDVWRYWSFFDAPRLSMASMIDGDAFSPFGEAGTDTSSETGWCSLIEGDCGWAGNPSARAGYNSTWNGAGVRLGWSAAQGQPSCGPDVLAYMGLGGSYSSRVAGVQRQFSVTACNSSCCGQDHSRNAAGQVWVR